MILAAGLSPAWQQVLEFDEFIPGEVNRASRSQWCASGKVLNAACAVYHLGGPIKALTVVGGRTGSEIREDIARQGISSCWVESVSSTRICTTILDHKRKKATELVPQAEEISQAEREAFLAAYEKEAKIATVVIVIGSLPRGTPANFHLEMLGRTQGKVILDAQGPPLLQALDGKPFLVKPNREELARTLGKDLKCKDNLYGAMKEINDRGAEWVLITDGEKPAYARSAQGLFQISPLHAAVVNPIGCGDCLTAGIAWATFHGRDMIEALRYGFASATDKVGRPLPGIVDRVNVENLAPLVNITLI